MEKYFISYIKILRPKLWIPSVISMFIGVVFTLNIYPTISFSFFYLFLALLIIGPFIGGGAVVLNQYFDYKEDKYSVKKEKYLLVTGKIGKRNALLYAVCLLIIGILLAFYINFEVFIITLIAVFFSIIYSTPPLRFKRRVFLDSITNGICYGILPTLVGFVIVSSFSLKALIIGLPLFLGYTAGHMLLAIPDMENDKKFGLHTTAVILGYKNTVAVAMSLFLSMLIILGVYIYTKILPLGVVIIFPIGIYIIKEHIELFKKGEKVRKKVYERLSLEFPLMVIIFLIILLISRFEICFLL